MDELQLEVADYTDLDHWRWRLTDAGGAFLADYTVALDRAAPLYQAFVDLYPYLRYYAAPDRQLEHEAELLAEVGHWIGAQVWGSVGEKMLEAAPVTVHVRLPAAMAGLAYRPLELGYVQDYPLALQEVSLVFEVGEPRPPSRKQPINETLRMLAVFSLPTDTSVLGLRQERYALKRLIQRIAQTQRKAIELRVLQYGVTREQLQATLEEGEGWDVLHFSGHGLPAGLVLERPNGRQDRISVRDLERLLRPARPRLKLVTLSACESAAPTVQETLRWLKLPEPQRSEAEARAEPAPAIAAEPLPALARSLAERLGCAVLAMRYPVGDAFAIEFAGRFYRALFEQRRNLPAALQLALPQALPAHPQPGMPALSVAAPALFGLLAASLTLPLPPGALPPFDLSQPGMAEFPPEPEHFVGRGGPLARGSMAMAPESGQRAVLFYGMAGVGKTACALELAYRYETGRFERLVWHRGPDEGHDIADALLRLAIDLERQLPGFTMAHVVDRADEFTAWLPRLRELLEQRSILIVLDNLESLLTAEGHWRDACWEALVSVLMDHGGLSRTVLTSRRRPLDLRYETRILIEAIHPLSLAEAALLARELPHLGALLQGKHPAGLEGGRELVTYALQVVQGHPKLLEFAEAQARDPQALAGHLAQAADSERREGQLQAFFREGESDLPAEVFLVALEDWTRRIAGRLPPGVRTLFYMLCALEEEDRGEFVLKRVWSNLWRRLQSLGEVPSLAHGLALLVESGLIEAQPEGDSITRYGLHPAVAEAGWAEAGAALQAAVDRELAAMWQAIFQQGMEAEEQRRGSLIGRGQLAVGAGWRAVPYLLRRERWAEAGFLIEQIVLRDPSPAILAAVLPWLRRTVTATAGTPEGLGHLGVLARVLGLAGRWSEAETTMRETISLAAAQGDFRLASAATGDLINLLRDTGHLDKALAYCDELQAYTRQAGSGRWAQLGDEAQRLQVLAELGRYAEVLAAVQRLRQELHALSEASAQEEMVHALGVQRAILNAGEVAAARLHYWETALALNTEAVALQEAHGASALQVARTRFNAHLPLLRLHCTQEVRALLQTCRAVFETAGDLQALGLLFGALASLEARDNHHAAAVAFEEASLRYQYLRGDPGGCAIGHFDLALDVMRSGSPPEVALAHALAAGIIAFQIESGLLPAMLQVLVRLFWGLPHALSLAVSFGALCAVVEQVEGVRFQALVERLPRRALTGEAALAEVLRLIHEQTASATEL